VITNPTGLDYYVTNYSGKSWSDLLAKVQAVRSNTPLLTNIAGDALRLLTAGSFRKRSTTNQERDQPVAPPAAPGRQRGRAVDGVCHAAPFAPLSGRSEAARKYTAVDRLPSQQSRAQLQALGYHGPTDFTNNGGADTCN